MKSLIFQISNSKILRLVKGQGINFSMLAAKLSEMITKFRGAASKFIIDRPFDLNGPQNGPFLHFKNSLKSMRWFKRLMGAMNCR